MTMRSIVFAITSATLAALPMRATDLPEQRLPVNGGSGGTMFTRSCGDGRVLTGLRYREGLLVDAVGLLCRPVNADGSLGTESAFGTLVGGGGGTSGSISCPSGAVVGGVIVAYGTYVDGIRILCRAWTRSTRQWGDYRHPADPDVASIYNKTTAKAECESRLQPVVAIRGREDTVVDAFGVTCDEP